MIIEKILFNIISFILLAYIFGKLILKNDTNYIYVLSVQAVGVILNFIEILAATNFHISIKILMYILSIIIPLVLIIVEKKYMNITEIIMLIKCKKSESSRISKNIIFQVLDKYPDSYIAHKKLASIYEKEENKELAIDEYVRAVEINGKDYDSYYTIAVLLNDLDKKDEAITILNKLLKTNNSYYKASILLGEMLYSQERYKEAINIYTMAIKNNENDYDLYYKMGMTYTMMNDFQNAKICYEKAALINSMLFNAYYNLGQINLIFNDINISKQCFLKSTESPENEIESYYHLALIEMIEGNEEKAIKFLDEAIKMDEKIYDKIFHEPIFITIRNKVIKPSIEQYNTLIINKNKKLTEKEIKVNEHLDNMYSIVGSLNNMDTKVVMEKKIKSNQLDIEDIQKE